MSSPFPYSPVIRDVRERKRGYIYIKKMPVLSSYRNQSIDCKANQLTGFYIWPTLALNGLNEKPLLR